MNLQTRPMVPDFAVPHTAPSHSGRSVRLGKEQREFNRMVAVAFVLLLVPAALGRLSGWRWRPWPPGKRGYGSLVAEAREAARTTVATAYLGY